MSAGPVRPDDVDGDRQRAAAENRQLAAQEEKEARYHAEMAVCLSTVGDKGRARSERSRATVLRRAAQIKRDLAMKCEPGGIRSRGRIWRPEGGERMRAVDEPGVERTGALAEALLVCALVVVVGALVGVFAGPIVS